MKKNNLQRTFSGWQLISHDYSINNPFIADEYHKAGLPGQFHFTYPNISFTFLHHNIPSGGGGRYL